jgi:hypothetical protein
MTYDCILIGSRPVNLIEAMFLSKNGEGFILPDPRLVNYIHCHLINDLTRLS